MTASDPERSLQSTKSIGDKSLSYRGKNPRKNILDAVVETRRRSWSDSTKETARSDAYRVLEALVSKLGVEDVIAAMDYHGFDGAAYRYLVVPLYEEAVSRRPPFEQNGG